MNLFYKQIKMAQKEFVDALAFLRSEYNLSREKIATIAGINEAYYGLFENCKKKLGLDDADNISFKVWGVRYTQFVEFAKKEIEKDKLPLLTQIAIEKSKNIKLKDTENLLATELDRLINKGELNSPKTSKILHSMMKKKLQKRNSTEITNLLNKKPRKEIIIKLKVRFKGENIYVHRDYLKEYEKLSAEEFERTMEL